MLAPSPDWYVWIVNLKLYRDSKFIEGETIKGVVYDAGTDSGTTYKSANLVTNPKGKITKFVSSPLGDGI